MAFSKLELWCFVQKAVQTVKKRKRVESDTSDEVSVGLPAL